MMQKYQDSSLSPEERASDLLARMNLDEKFGQIQNTSTIHCGWKKTLFRPTVY